MYLPKMIRDKLSQLNSIEQKIDKLHESLGRLEARQLEQLNKPTLGENEFQVYSQWGEDGIIQHLLRNIEIDKKIFIEFGVEKYTESNTRFLLVNNEWSGLVIDGSEDNITFIKSDAIYWQHNLKAECSFITKNNINQLFKKNGISGEIGILSVDIDGNDYWVWDAIDSVNPAIVIAEYNARFGSTMSVTVPYDPSFVRSKKHFSMIYYGASLQALCGLAQKKGYAFVGCNSAGNNAFYVRRDVLGKAIKELTVSAGYVRNHFRESRDEFGNLTFLSPEKELEILLSLPLVEVPPVSPN